jgi:hypothetical protein
VSRAVPLLARTWILASRARRRLRPPSAPRAGLVERYAPGRTFADIGCMWRVNGELAFLAEAAGATAVTGLDVMEPTPEYLAEHQRRGSSVRFVHGDIHDPAAAEEVGPHDVVWCGGVLYHAPNPLLTLQRLRGITRELLLLATETIPEVPGLAQACVFFPGLPDPDRRAQASARPGSTAEGLTTRFDPAQSYGAWWWGISRSALRGMLLASGFELVEQFGDGLHATVVARPVFAPG